MLSVSGSLRGKSSLAVVSPTDPLLIAAGLHSSLHSSAGGRTGWWWGGWREQEKGEERGRHRETRRGGGVAEDGDREVRR